MQRFGIRGYASAVHTACASGGQAIGAGAALIRRGAADRVLAGGFDSMINPVGLAGFCLLGALSPTTTQPQRASRPFDRTRNGFVLGEGAGFLVLERGDAARRRGARDLCRAGRRGQLAEQLPHHRFASVGRRSDSGDAARRWPTPANRRRRRSTISTPTAPRRAMNDRSECAAVRAVFGAHADRAGGQLDEEPDGPPDRRRRRGRGGALRAGAARRRRAGQRQPRRARSRLRSALRHRRAAAPPAARRAVQFLRVRRLEQLPGVAQPAD